MHYDFIRNGTHVRLFNQDCMAGMRRHLEPGSVDVVVTSPPYNLGVKYGRYDDTISRSSYLQWLDEWACVTKEVMGDNASLFLNIGSKPSDPSVPFQALAVMQRHFVLQNVIHWIKSIAISKADVGDYAGITQDVAVGHFKPINSKRYLNDCHEYVFHLTKRGDVALDRLAIGVAYQDKSNVGRWSKKRDVRCRGNTWFIPYQTIKDRERQRPHPASFPPRLAETCMRLHGLERIHCALDPFLGIGSSALASTALKIEFTGFEIDPHYLEVAVQRLKSS